MTAMVHHVTEADPEDAIFSPRAATPRRAGKPRRKPESEVVSEAKAMLNTRQGAYFRKVHGGAMGNVGEPDLDGCEHGRAVKLEAKAGSEKPTGPQMGAMRRWAKVGALVGWFRNNEHVNQIMDHVSDPDFVPDLDHPGCSCAKHGGDA